MNQNSEFYNENNGYSGKRLFRNPENKIIGGVLSGFSYYLNIEVFWLRLIFLILTFALGMSLLVYPLLWILIPKAKTEKDFLQMKGMYVSSYFEDYRDENRIGENLKKIIAYIFIIIGISGFISSLFGAVGVSTSYFTINGFPITEYSQNSFIIGLTSFLFGFLPSLLMFLFGIKILRGNFKNFGKVVLFLIGIWIINLFFSISHLYKMSLMNQEKIILNESKVIEKPIQFEDIQTIQLESSDLYKISFVDDPRTNELNDDHYVLNDKIKVEFITTDNNPNIEIKVENFTNKEFSPDFYKYYFQINSKNEILLSNTLIEQEIENFSEVKIRIFIPKGSQILLNKANAESKILNLGLTDGTKKYELIKGYLVCMDCQ